MAAPQRTPPEGAGIEESLRMTQDAEDWTPESGGILFLDQWRESPYIMPTTFSRMAWGLWYVQSIAWSVKTVLLKNWILARAYPAKALGAVIGCVLCAWLCPYFGAMAVAGCLAWGARPPRR